MSLHPALSGDKDREMEREEFFKTVASLRALASADDIAKLMLYENNLWESRRFMTDIFDSILEGIDIIDKNMDIVQANKVLEAAYQGSMPIVGKRCYRVFAGRDEPCEQCPSLMAMKDKMTHSATILLSPGTETEAWVHVTTFPLLDGDGNVQYIIEHSRNVTEGRNAEKALSEAMMQAELYLDLMGHDINNMNQIGMGFLELALSYPGLDERCRSMISRSLMAFENSSRLIDNVRKLQKVRSGEVRKKEVDAGLVLSDVCRHYTGLHSAGLTINYTPVEGAVVMANELLFDLFSNLVGNAIKHSNGPPVIDVALSTESVGPEKYYLITVEDNGPGVPDEMKTLVFNRQLRGGPHTKGSGMGLYLVKALADDFRGRVWVEDRVPGDCGSGSRFVVLLPALER